MVMQHRAYAVLLARIDKPIIAAVHGYGVWAPDALACSDLTVAAECAVRLSGAARRASAIHGHRRRPCTPMGAQVAFELLTLRDQHAAAAPTTRGWSTASCRTTG